jgi:hypothetical protein
MNQTNSMDKEVRAHRDAPDVFAIDAAHHDAPYNF